MYLSKGPDQAFVWPKIRRFGFFNIERWVEKHQQLGCFKNTSNLAHKGEIVAPEKRCESGNFGLADTSAPNLSFGKSDCSKVISWYEHSVSESRLNRVFFGENPKVAHRLNSACAVRDLFSRHHAVCNTPRASPVGTETRTPICACLSMPPADFR